MKVAIIGAGVAGLTAARALVARGIQVQVFEKSRGVGGRLANKRLELGNVDIGAQYFTARDQRFQQQVALWQAQGLVSEWQFTPHRLEATGLTPSPDATTRFVGTPKMNLIAHDLARDINITFSERIQGLNKTTAGWQLNTERGNTLQHHYDWVVVSAPAEQCKTLLAGTALEHKIPDNASEPCWALILATRGKVPEGIQGIFGDNVVAWVSRVSSRPGRSASKEYDDLWVLHFASEWTVKNPKNRQDGNNNSDIESLTHNDVGVLETGISWLQNVLASHVNTPLQVVHSYKHYWRYARVAAGMAPPRMVIDKTANLAAIGDWVVGGRVEGAYLSALDFVDYAFGAP